MTTENLIRSKYADIMVKVDADVYHLDRLQLACKSDYFEKLFTDDFHEKKCDLIEFPVMDSDTFSTVVDIMYGQELESVLNFDNYVTLLMAMDYLQMNIDLKIYKGFIRNVLGKKPTFDTKIFQLSEYLAQNRNFEDLMQTVFIFLSEHLTKAGNYKEFLCLSLDHFVGTISTQRFGFQNVDNIRECCRICVEWIFHDIENRLPHGVKLVNAAKHRLMFPHVTNDQDFSVQMRNAGEEITPDAVLRKFYKMVVCQGEIGEESYYIVDKQETTAVEGTSIKNPNTQNEREKMAKFLDNGDFYDITVKVEEKTYKLHRYKLLSSSGYFAHIFSTELSEATRQPNKDEEYSLDVEGVDRTTFELSIKYIYGEEIALTCDTIIGILNAANGLKISNLLDECESWIKDNLDSISFQVVAEILNFIRQNDNARWKFLQRFLLCKRILVNWPKIYDFSPFCAISIEILEDLLVSSTFHVNVDSSSLPADFCIDDPFRLLDICSKWIIDDVQNRYQFIPRIALAINRNYTLFCDDFKPEAVSDWSTCSQQFVRDELEKMLSSTSPIPRGSSNENSRKFEEEPIFVLSKCGRAISIRNADFVEIASLWFFERPVLSNSSFIVVSAATIDDNVFIAYSVPDFFSAHISFQVFNISSKKFTSLARIPPTSKESDLRYVLLNCRSDVYCCFQNGYVLKYLPQLNRWMIFWVPEGVQETVHFASDGKALFRILRSQKSSSTFNFNMYDFRQKKWHVIPGITKYLDSSELNRTCEMIIINGCDIAVREPTSIQTYCSNVRFAPSISLPEMCYAWEFLSTVAQCETGILFVRAGKLYQLDDHQVWQLKKEFRVESVYGESELFCFENVAGIHRPMARIENVVLQ